jgi:hypothetical protein
MLLADMLLPNPPLLLLRSLARASAAHTSTPCYCSSCCWTRAHPGLAPLARATPAAATLLLLARRHATAAAPPAPALRACTASRLRVHAPAPPPSTRPLTPPARRCLRSTRAPAPHARLAPVTRASAEPPPCWTARSSRARGSACAAPSERPLRPKPPAPCRFRARARALRPAAAASRAALR